MRIERSTVDITGAYLNAYMSHKKVVIKIPPDITCNHLRGVSRIKQFLQSNGWLYVLLVRALHGFVESARLWYKLLRRSLESIGLEQNSYDECVFNKTIGGAQVIVAFHVYDC